MTRHQRRKASASRKVSQRNAEIVRNNLSTPCVREVTGLLISQVYANRMDRARGRGTTPIHRQVTRVISRQAIGWNKDA